MKQKLLNIPDELYLELKEMAHENRISENAEIIKALSSHVKIERNIKILKS